MNRLTATLALSMLLVALVPFAEAQSSGTYYGDGSDGAITRAASASETSSVIVQATTYTINSGVTMTCNQGAGAAMVILATVSIDIQGTLDCNGRGSAGGAAGTTGTSGVGSPGVGSTGTGSVAGGAGNSPRTLIQILQCQGSAGGTMGAGGGGGGSGDTVNVRSGGSGGGGIKAGGASGAAGTTTALGGTAGAGGNGGGGVYLIAPTITIGAAGVVTVNGANGAAGTSNSGGGGGGAGGLICLWSRDLTLTAGYTLTATGGNGGNGGGAGATGGTGGTIAAPTPTTGSAPSSTGGGGGGGGAGGLLIKRTGSPDGYSSVAATATEAPGANCADGGIKITHGLDNGDGGGTARDNTLQAGEIDDTEYICDGADGANGADGTDGTDGADGDPGPIGITWQGQWDDSTSYAERDAVHYAGSAWYCLNAPCDDAPAPGDGFWDFIANADGNVIVPASVDVTSATGDFWVPVVLWLVALLFFLKLGKLMAAGACTAGLGLALATGSNLGWASLALILLVLALWLEATLMERVYQRWFGDKSGRKAST